MMFCRPVSRRYQISGREPARRNGQSWEAHSCGLANINQHIITSCFRLCMPQNSRFTGCTVLMHLLFLLILLLSFRRAGCVAPLEIALISEPRLRASESSRARGCFPFFGLFWLSFIIISSVHTVDITSVSSFFQTFRSRTGPRCTPRCSKPRPNPISTRKA